MAAAVGFVSRTPLRCFRASASLPIYTSSYVSRRVLVSGISRLPVELISLQSLMPFHSATASALLTSKLSLKRGSWGWLSEGFAMPL